MRKALTSLPSKLSSFYQDILNRIIQVPDQYDVAQTVFGLILRSTRPPTVLEIQQCVAIEQGEDLLNPEDLSDPEDALMDIDFILDCCDNLVVFDDQNETLRFAHSTVGEFLESQSIRRLSKSDLIDQAFPGLFLSSTTFENELDQDPQDAESTFGSEIFSQFSTDGTLLPSEKGKANDPLGSVATGKPSYVPDQLIFLFLTDPAFPVLVNSAINAAGSSGFDKSFSQQLRLYSEKLEGIATKPSQKVAALLAGQRTRRLSSRLRSSFPPKGTEEQEQNDLTVGSESSGTADINRWLTGQHTNSAKTSYITERSWSEVPRHEQAQSANRDQAEILNQSDDEDLRDTYTDLYRVKEFLINTGPFIELKMSLILLAHPELQGMEKSTSKSQNKVMSQQSDSRSKNQSFVLRRSQIQDIWNRITSHEHVNKYMALPILSPNVKSRAAKISVNLHNVRANILEAIDSKRRQNDDFKHFQWTCVSRNRFLIDHTS